MQSSNNFNQEKVVDEPNAVLNACNLSQVSLHEENISSEENSSSDEDQSILKVKKTSKVELSDKETCNESSANNEDEIYKIKRTKKNKKNCLICKSSKNKLYKISQHAITDVFIKTRILISENIRACSHHFVDLSKHTRLKSEAMNKIEYIEDTTMTVSNELKNLLESVSSLAYYNQLGHRFSRIETMQDIECRDLLGKKDLIFRFR